MDLLRRAIASLIFLIAITAAIILGPLALRRVDERPRTDDAFLTADIVHMAPDVSGRIVELRVAENQLVEKDEILFVIDPEPFRYRVEEAHGKIKSLEAQLADKTNSVASQKTSAEAARTEIAAAQAELLLASQTRTRLQPLQKPGYISAEQLDQAKTSEKTARTKLEHTRQAALAAQQAILSTKETEADLATAKVSLKSVERDPRLTVVRSPCRGRITSLSVAAGEYAKTGSAVFTIIDTDHWWAIGNFRETDLDKLKIGDRARVFVMSDPSRPVYGMLTNVGFGVSPQEDQPSGGLPSVPRSLNWVRIAQRFPVRIRLETPPPGLMRIGASVVIVVEANER